MLCIETQDYPSVIKECFSQDSDLVEKYHIAAGTGLESCVQRTVEDLDNCHESFKFYKVENEGKLFGFFGKEHINNISYLTSFFVMPQYRNSSDLRNYWNLVNDMFVRQPFLVGIYAKNERASKFLNKCGGLCIAQDDLHKVKVFAFNSGVK